MSDSYNDPQIWATAEGGRDGYRGEGRAATVADAHPVVARVVVSASA